MAAGVGAGCERVGLEGIRRRPVALPPLLQYGAAAGMTAPAFVGGTFIFVAFTASRTWAQSSELIVVLATLHPLGIVSDLPTSASHA